MVDDEELIGELLQMLSVRPDLPIVLMRGYVGEGVSQSPEQMGFASHIKKPFRAEQISLAVREVLGARGAASP